MELKKKDLVRLSAGIKSVENLEAGVKFSYATAKNQRLLSGEVEALQESYEKERMKLINQFAEKNGEGPKVVAGEYVIADKDGFARAMKGMNESFGALMEETVEVSIHQVEMGELPTKITPGQVAGIFELIKPS